MRRMHPQQRRRRSKSSQDVIIAFLETRIDRAAIARSLAMTPTERLETMRRAALTLEASQSGQGNNPSDLAEIRNVLRQRDS